MNAVIEKFLALSMTKKLLIWIGSLLFLFYLFWQFVYSEMGTQIFELEEELERVSSQITQQHRIVKKLPKIKAEVAALDEKLGDALKELPDQREIPDLLSSVSNLALESGLEVSKFTPRGEQRRDFYAEVPVSITVEGTYHQLATFFDEVGQLRRIVNIQDIKVRQLRKGQSAVYIKGECTATTFRYLDDGERGGGGEGDGKRRRRRKKA